MNKYQLLFLFLILSRVSSAQEDATVIIEQDEVEQTIDEINDNEIENDSQPAKFESINTKKDSLELRKVDSKEWAKLKKDKRFIYKKPIPKVKKPKKKKDLAWLSSLMKFLESDGFKILLYCLLGLFLLYIVYMFIKNNDISFSRNIKDKGIQQEEPWEDVQQFENWEHALQEALAAKDFRLATRIYYLHTLHLLDKNNRIKYRDDKTNWFYVQKIFGTAMHDDFKGLTQNFDYIWYGEYQIDQERFTMLQSQFQQFHSTIS